MTLKQCAPIFLTLAFLLTAGFVTAFAGGAEFTGQFEPSLVANAADFERVILKSASFERFKDTPPSQRMLILLPGRFLIHKRSNIHSWPF